MNTPNIIAKVDNIISYRPIPFFKDTEQTISNIKQKLDLNLFCIKRPHKTCFIQVTNEAMVSWGIEIGDILVVEKVSELTINDLIVLEKNNQFSIYEFIAHTDKQFIFLPVDNKQQLIKVEDWHSLPIVGVITNNIHQMRPQKKMKFVA
ncbi:peptidase S24-like protein [Bisgaardia hudsonensis]|uniref:Peptidase S24-like protein n=1 Tax=Bisgaardia hudsonensis TaxID=109472 RepID=A0A4R2N1N3_9PAST|nr:S24 family peptidase [Bisgaardia hudsonensis]QLB13003.1 type VI secretion protein ImpA [Bisgaardia hudsonensis]TCP13433.1 peptidase S24-like protein [Bisgaardia hudsonensis]